MKIDGGHIPQISLEELEKEQDKKKRQNRFFALILAFVYCALILIFTGQMNWGQTPVFIEAVIIWYLWDFGPLKKFVGEIGRPKRSKTNYILSWAIAIIFITPLAIFMLDASNWLIEHIDFANFDWKTILVITPGTLLISIAGIIKSRNISDDNKKRMKSISNKIGLSYTCLVLYFLLISLVNKIGINPALVPEIQNPAINISLGFSFWLASLLFFSAAFLVLFSIGDIFDMLENS
jgi:hypothetical protein